MKEQKLNIKTFNLYFCNSTYRHSDSRLMSKMIHVRPTSLFQLKDCIGLMDLNFHPSPP